MNNISFLPTSEMEVFKEQLKNPNKHFKNLQQKNEAIAKVQKHIVISQSSDCTGCGHIRNIFPMSYLNSIFGKTGRFNLVMTPPGIFIFQPEILQRTRTIFFQRTMAPQQIQIIKHYKELQKKFQFKMIYDIDDFIWTGDDIGEDIPLYNFGKKTISPEVQRASIEIMKLMDIVCVSTKFLGDYIASKGIDKNKIKVVHNTVAQAFWGSNRKLPITEQIKKPKVIWSASPTHWSDEKRLAGDMDNAWQEWVINSVIDRKIDFFQMGGLPWFFEPIKDKITVVPWLNSYQYHLAILNIRPDFGIAPLVPNYFNYSKSAIKYQEYCAVGALGIGTTFKNGRPSPYDICQVKVPDTITINQINDLFSKLCEPNTYNNIIKKQYDQMMNENWYTESQGYVKMLMEIF